MSIRIRPQYHVRKTSTGFDAWKVRRLIALAVDLPVVKIDPTSISDIHKNHWYMEANATPSPLSIVNHIKLINDCDLTYPIILDRQGHVMDGMHRICKAILQNLPKIDAVQFITDPEPDYVDCDPKDLPYES